VSEWMIRRLDPQQGDTVLELAAGLADTGLMAARLVGESGRVIVTGFSLLRWSLRLAGGRRSWACRTLSLGYSMPSEWT
jgi:hypothetical protein